MINEHDNFDKWYVSDHMLMLDVHPCRDSHCNCWHAAIASMKIPECRVRKVDGLAAAVDVGWNDCIVNFKELNGMSG